eukprot:TRINITY_DN4225_c0_g2_i1.p1 TRINITY_DN4225_c0_g2~~TRINITY_DN4225_c0_g2_i1.p1  ORF type:complete len:405 (-),score=75.42 TRINITY_DN4225_c0_g2_i1:137-1351(-)
MINLHKKFCCLLCIFIMIMILLYLYSLLTAPEPLTERNYPIPPNPEKEIYLKDITQMSGKSIDEEWLPILKYDKIAKVKSFHSGLSYKFKVTFSSGYVAMCKLIEPIKYYQSTNREMNPFDTKRDKNLFRADRKYQGWSEVVGYHIDRIFNFYRKPPIVSRIISNKELFIYDSTLVTKFKRWLHENEIYVTMHAWVPEIYNTPPPKAKMKLLSHQSPINTKDLNHHYLEDLLLISDSLVFDLLVDDHDRKWDFNWKSASNGHLLIWDSGLAFRHGPIGESDCLDILCGSTYWIQKNTENNDTYCQRISVFRRDTVNFLRKHNSKQPPEKRLSYLLKERIESDDEILHPIWQFGTFWSGSNEVFRGGRLRFLPEVYYRGFDYRVSLMLSWIDHCIEQYGEDLVLY